MDLRQQLTLKQQKLKELESRLSSQETLSDPKKIKEVNEAYADTKEMVDIGERFHQAVKNLEHAKNELEQTQDEEFKEMITAEIDTLESSLPALKDAFERALVPPDPLDKKNVIMEIRAGAGGNEAALFAADIFRMYMRFAERQGWKTTIISSHQNDLGGFKEVIFSIHGNHVYGSLKFESGVHRVQRVPETEKQGRVHTSTATVAVLPEAEEVDVQIDPKDLKIEATTSTGAGGQSVNTTYSAVRITHLPTGLMVYCQDERSQAQNKEKALAVIRARVFALEEERRQQELAAKRKGQVGTGGRAEKIRTYNYPQDRVTDHRLGQNFSNLPVIMDGDLEDIITQLQKVS